MHGGPDDGYMYAVTGLDVKGQPERKIDLKFASCMNDPAALAAQKERQSFTAKIKQIGWAAKNIWHRGVPY